MTVSFIRRPALATGLALILGSVLPVLADYIPLPVKWSQPIQFDPLGAIIIGRDRLSDHTREVVRADDFICLDPKPIVAVRWWGSYIGNQSPRPNQPGFLQPFEISFHLSTVQGGPGSPGHPFSLPVGTPLLMQTVLAQEFFVGLDQVGDAVYRYDAFLPQPFEQLPGTEYFLDICKPTQENWGWHETPLINLDFPAWAPTHMGPWANDPPHDLAFELMVVPEPGLAIWLGAGSLLLFQVWRRRSQVS
jgi:hypothetical protein